MASQSHCVPLLRGAEYLIYHILIFAGLYFL